MRLPPPRWATGRRQEDHSRPAAMTRTLTWMAIP
jgi:hypothetical protein